jgi:hypothetical protein
VPVQFFSAFNFQQHTAFSDQYDPDDFCLLNHSSKGMAHFPFPDMREFDREIANRIRNWAECSPCPHCRAVLVQGMPDGFRCNPFRDRIRSNLPPPMDEGLLNRNIELIDSNQKIPRFLNRDLRSVLQYAFVSSLNAKASNLFTSGIPYALETYRQFTTLVYAVFSHNDRELPWPLGDIEESTDFILSQNRTLPGYLRDRLDLLRQISIEPVNESDEGMNVAVFNAEGLLLNDHQTEVLRSSYQPQKLSQSYMLYDPLVYPLIFWTGAGGCGIVESERLQGSTTFLRQPGERDMPWNENSCQKPIINILNMHINYL